MGRELYAYSDDVLIMSAIYLHLPAAARAKDGGRSGKRGDRCDKEDFLYLLSICIKY
jgi:hypothetical protein